MRTPSFQEDHISQIPALRFLQSLGYTYLSPEEALAERNGKTGNVLLENILRAQLQRINRIQYKGESYHYTEANIQTGINALKEIPLQEGLITANQSVYELLTLGKSLEQTIEGDKKSHTLQYIDWKDWKHNTFHVTEEYKVQRAGSHEHYVPDIVLFVNGIPLVVIECKRPDRKEPLSQAISQHLRNQREDGIRLLYAYSQLLLSLATHAAAYATTATKEKFWSKWKEQTGQPGQLEQELAAAKNAPLSLEQEQKLLQSRSSYTRHMVQNLLVESQWPTEQDHYMYCLCRPERLLDLVFNFIVFDAGIKKIARYQQYFAIKKTMERITVSQQGKRTGGVVWHTQGSGKSLTMVMLAQAIALDKTIRNPKIVIVTDRVDLDDQIYGTFDKCQIPVLQAKTGKHLVELLGSKSDAVITTIINKFETAVNQVLPLRIFLCWSTKGTGRSTVFSISVWRKRCPTLVLSLSPVRLCAKRRKTPRKNSVG